jgi:hypothetical protein
MGGVPTEVRRLIGLPSINSRPWLTGVNPTAAFARLLFPDPDSPTRPTTRPDGTVRLTSSTATIALRPVP